MRRPVIWLGMMRVDLALAAGPRPDHGVLLQLAQFGRMHDALRRPATSTLEPWYSASSM